MLKSLTHRAILLHESWPDLGWPGPAWLRSNFTEVPSRFTALPNHGSFTVGGPGKIGWPELAWAGLGWAGLAWVGRSWPELVCAGLDWLGLVCAGLDWAGLAGAGLGWPELA